MRQRIDILFVVNGTTERESYTADKSVVCMGIDATTVKLSNGEDEFGNSVKDVIYKEAYRVERRFIDDKSEV